MKTEFSRRTLLMGAAALTAASTLPGMYLSNAHAAEVVQKTLDYIAEDLIAGNTIELRNFGVFEIKVRKSRKGRNPNQPKNEVIIPERAVVKFRAGKELKEAVEKLNPAQFK